MLSCRTLFRIDRVLRFTSRCVKSKPESSRIISFRENAAMDGFKKQKMVNLVWRPISTQSSSIRAEAGNEVQEAAQCSKSSDVSVEVIEGGVNQTASVVSAGKHSVSLEVGASLIRFIRGKEGTTQMKLEEEMGVKIILPSSRNKDHIKMGIEKSIFVSPKTFHLTVVMLKLENNESVIKAQNILKSISSNVRQALKNRPVFIRLRGLDCMNGSLDKTRVLYAPVEEVGHEGRLLNACHVIIDAFEKAGFAGKDAKSRLK